MYRDILAFDFIPFIGAHYNLTVLDRDNDAKHTTKLSRRNSNGNQIKWVFNKMLIDSLERASNYKYVFGEYRCHILQVLTEIGLKKNVAGPYAKLLV